MRLRFLIEFRGIEFVIIIVREAHFRPKLFGDILLVFKGVLFLIQRTSLSLNTFLHLLALATLLVLPLHSHCKRTFIFYPFSCDARV